MNFRQNTGKTIREAFEEYHRENPVVYGYFKRLAFKAIEKGKKKISFKLILNVIRWEVYIDTIERNLFNQGDEQIKFKINDAYGAHYASMFAEEYPEHTDKIEMRRLRSE
jgi:hypothetical protein